MVKKTNKSDLIIVNKTVRNLFEVFLLNPEGSYPLKWSYAYTKYKYTIAEEKHNGKIIGVPASGRLNF